MIGSIIVDDLIGSLICDDLILHHLLYHNIFRPQKTENKDKKQARLVFTFENQTYEAETHDQIVNYANAYYACITLHIYKESSYQYLLIY